MPRCAVLHTARSVHAEQSLLPLLAITTPSHTLLCVLLSIRPCATVCPHATLECNAGFANARRARPSTRASACDSAAQGTSTRSRAGCIVCIASGLHRERAVSRAGCDLCRERAVSSSPWCTSCLARHAAQRSFLRPAPCKGLRRAAHANGVVVLRSMLRCVLGSSVVVYPTSFRRFYAISCIYSCMLHLV